MKRDQEQIKNLWELVHGLNDGASRNQATLAATCERLYGLYDRITEAVAYTECADPGDDAMVRIRRILRGES